MLSSELQMAPDQVHGSIYIGLGFAANGLCGPDSQFKGHVLMLEEQGLSEAEGTSVEYFSTHREQSKADAGNACWSRTAKPKALMGRDPVLCNKDSGTPNIVQASCGSRCGKSESGFVFPFFPSAPAARKPVASNVTTIKSWQPGSPKPQFEIKLCGELWLLKRLTS